MTYPKQFYEHGKKKFFEYWLSRSISGYESRTEKFLNRVLESLDGFYEEFPDCIRINQKTFSMVYRDLVCQDEEEGYPALLIPEVTIYFGMRIAVPSRSGFFAYPKCKERSIKHPHVQYLSGNICSGNYPLNSVKETTFCAFGAYDLFQCVLESHYYRDGYSIFKGDNINGEKMFHCAICRSAARIGHYSHADKNGNKVCNACNVLGKKHDIDITKHCSTTLSRVDGYDPSGRYKSGIVFNFNKKKFLE